MTHPYTTWLIYGIAGLRKTTAALTWPRPSLWLCTDPRPKSLPILRAGEIEEDEPTPEGAPAVNVWAPNGSEELLHRVEYYHDRDPKNPHAAQRLERRLARLPREAKEWETVVLDSVTTLKQHLLMDEKYRTNPNAKDGRRWYGGAAERLRELLFNHLAFAEGFNVVVIAHTAYEKDEIGGYLLFHPNAVGQVGMELPDWFGEVYRVHLPRGSMEDGKVSARGTKQAPVFQTVASTSYVAGTRIGAPDGCELNYNALWGNYDKQGD